MKRLITLLVVTAALAVPATASASTTTVPLIGCAFGGGATVPAGDDVALRFTWGDKTDGLVRDFLNAQTTIVSVNGGPAADASRNYGSVSGAASHWFYDTGASLAAGQSMTVTLDVLLSHKLKDRDATAMEGHPVFNGPGSVFGGPITCTITGA